MSKKSRAREKVASLPSPRPGPDTFPVRWGTFLAGGIVVLAALATYHNSFSGPFIFDDLWSITTNPTLHQLGSALSPPPDKGVGGRPLLSFTFALNYALGGLNVWGYHVFNLLVHALAGLALFGIVRRTLLRPSFAKASEGRPGLGNRFRADATLLALAVAVIWVVHPIQTESVTYISQRAESLMGLFYLLTLYCFLRGAESKYQVSGDKFQESGSPNAAFQLISSAAFWSAASILCCLLGALSKENIATAPLMVLLYDRTFFAGSFREGWRLRWRYYLGLSGTWLLLAILMPGLGQRCVGFGQGVSWWSYALTSCRSVVLYCKLAFWPHPLVFDYGSTTIRQAMEALPYALVLMILLAAVAMALRYRPAIGFLGAWFFVILAPSSSIVPVAKQPMAEHRLYLSLAAVVALVVLGLYRLIGRRGLIVCAVAVIGLCWLSVQRNNDYRSSLAIWSDTLAKRPDNERAHTSVGTALYNIPGRMPDAIAEYEAALRINPGSAEAHNNLGGALSQMPGRLPEAIAEYQAAVRIEPDYIDARSNLGNAFLQMPGRLPDAIAEFQEILRMEPDDVGAHNKLGAALLQTPGRLADAMTQFETALRINPGSAEAHFDLGNALQEMPGRMPEAIAEYEAVVRINPGSAEAHYTLGTALLKVPGRRPDAMAEYEEALRIKPDYPEAHNNLGGLLAGDPDRISEAISHYVAAIRLRPDYAEAHMNLGYALLQMPGRLPEAISHFEAALRIKPDLTQVRQTLDGLRTKQR